MCVVNWPSYVAFRETPAELTDLLKTRQPLDRRRLEEAFLLFASLEVQKKYGLSLTHIPVNRNELAEAITGKFYDAFVTRWGGKCINHFFQITLIQMKCAIKTGCCKQFGSFIQKMCTSQHLWNIQNKCKIIWYFYCFSKDHLLVNRGTKTSLIT